MTDIPYPLAAGQLEVWLESEEAFDKLLRAMNSVFGIRTGTRDPVKATRLEKSICADWNAQQDARRGPCSVPGLSYVPPIPPGAKMWLLEAPLVHAYDKFALYAFVSGWSHGRECPEPTDPACRVSSAQACTPTPDDLEKKP